MLFASTLYSIAILSYSINKYLIILTLNNYGLQYLIIHCNMHAILDVQQQS